MSETFYGVLISPTFVPGTMEPQRIEHELLGILRGFGTVEVSITDLSLAVRRGLDVHAVAIDVNGERLFAVRIVS